MPRRKMDEQAGGNPRHDSPLSALSPRPLSLISLQSKAEFGDFLVLRGAGGASVKPSVPRLAVVKGVDMSRPSSSSWRTLNVRVGDPKNSITLSLSLSLRPNTRDSRSTQSHGNERMPSLVGNLVVALGRGRSRLPAPPWLALLVPVSAKSCLFFFLAPCRERCRVNTGFLHEAECKFKPREQKKKSGTFPSFDRDRDQTHRCVERRAGHGAGHPNEEGCRGVSGGERNVAEEEALAESSGDPARRSSHRFWMRTSRSHG